jgi:hypothetical protein
MQPLTEPHSFVVEPWSPTQHPAEVAAAARDLVQRSIDQPATVHLTRQILCHHLPPVWDVTGRYAPQAIHEFLRHGLRFIREPHGEWVADLEYTCAVGGGDCDDLAVAAATIAKQTGIPTWICWRWTGPSTAHMWAATGSSWLPQTESSTPTWHLDPFVAAPTTAAPSETVALRC